jgi:hypothetical protein
VSGAEDIPSSYSTSVLLMTDYCTKYTQYKEVPDPYYGEAPRSLWGLGPHSPVDSLGMAAKPTARLQHSCQAIQVQLLRLFRCARTVAYTMLVLVTPGPWPALSWPAPAAPTLLPPAGGPQGFELVLDLLEDACSGLLGSIREERGL